MPLLPKLGYFEKRILQRCRAYGATRNGSIFVSFVPFCFNPLVAPKLRAKADAVKKSVSIRVHPWLKNSCLIREPHFAPANGNTRASILWRAWEAKSVSKKVPIFDLFFQKNVSQLTHLHQFPTKTLP